MTAPDIPADLWEGATPATWRARWGVPDLRIFRAVGSTNDVARALAEEGAPEGTVVLADEQLRGRGRRGRGWSAPPGQGLLLSMVLRPREHAAAAVLPLRLGLAIAGAIEDATGVVAGIKWPNDLVAAGRKLGGVLCEAAVEGGLPQFVVAGIGLNVLQQDDDWPPELRGHATSVAVAAGAAVSRPDLAERVVRMVSIAARQGEGPLAPRERDELARRDVLRGEAVTVDGSPAGVAAGVDPDGALVVSRGGATRRVLSGTVRVIREAPEIGTEPT